MAIEKGPTLEEQQDPLVSPLAGIHGTMQGKVTVALVADETLPRLTPLGLVSATGKYKAFDASASNGQETLVAILVDDIGPFAADTDVTTEVYTHGEFNLTALVTEETVTAGIYNGGSIVIKEEVY